MAKILLKNGLVINRGKKEYKDVLIGKERIEKVESTIRNPNAKEINLEGKWIIPGIIDDQVHFREPGSTHKANIYTESRAALFGGVTSFMEMPNTSPAATTQSLLEDKYVIASQSSIVNYSFYIGATNDNIEEIIKTDRKKVCGIKAFMGSSTGNLLVDDEKALELLFKNGHMLIATHCEDENTIKANYEKFKKKFGKSLAAKHHPKIRNTKGCYLSSSKAVNLAKKFDARLHVLHISTEKELSLFENTLPLEEKKITSEVCVHHLFFNESDYSTLGNKIKCNPAIKSKNDQSALFKGLLENRLDIIATDHAPHTSEEKSKHYVDAPSGLPLVQHSLLIMLDFYFNGRISLENIVHKMCHAPAICFEVNERGFLDEGCFADITVVDPNLSYTINESNIAFKCGWSPLVNRTFRGTVTDVFVNGVHKLNNGKISDQSSGERLVFNR